MYPIQSVIDHIVNVYGFEIVPCTIPRNNFQYLKRNIYLKIYKYYPKLFYFLRDKVSPIKYLDKRPDDSIRFKKRISIDIPGINNTELIELEIKPVPIEAIIYTTDTKSTFKPDIHNQNYKVKFYIPMSVTDDIFYNSEIKTFPINNIQGINLIDLHFSDIPELKRILRDYKINSLYE